MVTDFPPKPEKVYVVRPLVEYDQDHTHSDPYAPLDLRTEMTEITTSGSIYIRIPGTSGKYTINLK